MAPYEKLSLLRRSLTLFTSDRATQTRRRVWASISKSRLSRDAVIYFVATAGNLGVPFLLLPVLTRYLEPGGYGWVTMFQTAAALMGTLTLFGLANPLLRAVSVESHAVQADYLAACLVISGGVTFFILAISAIFAVDLAHFMNLPRLWLAGALLSGIAGTIFQFKQTVLRGNHCSVWYGLLLNIQTLLNFGLSLALVVVFREGWKGRATAIIASSVAMAAWGLYSFHRSGMIGRIRREYLWEGLSLGGPACMYTMLTTLMTYGDRLFLGASYTPAVVGVYTTAAQLAAGYSTLGIAFNLAWGPWAFRRLAALGTRTDYRNLLRIMIGVCAITIVGALLYGLAIFAAFDVLIGDKYRGATAFFPILLGAACLQNLYSIFVFPLFYYRSSNILAALGLSLFIVALGCVFFLNGAFGPTGVAMTILIVRFLMLVAGAAAGIYLMSKGLAKAMPPDQPLPGEPEVFE